jgi:hypothetical protein
MREIEISKRLAEVIFAQDLKYVSLMRDMNECSTRGKFHVCISFLMLNCPRKTSTDQQWPLSSTLPLFIKTTVSHSRLSSAYGTHT